MKITCQEAPKKSILVVIPTFQYLISSIIM